MYDSLPGLSWIIICITAILYHLLYLSKDNPFFCMNVDLFIDDTSLVTEITEYVF